jgi:hypothetical protein
MLAGGILGSFAYVVNVDISKEGLLNSGRPGVDDVVHLSAGTVPGIGTDGTIVLVD